MSVAIIRKSLLYAATCLASGLLFANVYTSIVDARNWGRDIPASIEATREYFQPANPGTFFRIFSPINQIFGLMAVVLCWKGGKKLRLYAIIAFVSAVLLDLFTFGFFFPRNDIMFVNAIEGNVEAIRAAYSEWTTMNWVRSALNVVNVSFWFGALTIVIRGERTA